METSLTPAHQGESSVVKAIRRDRGGKEVRIKNPGRAFEDSQRHSCSADRVGQGAAGPQPT